MNGGGNTLSKELTVRKRIKSIYNKQQDDFSSLREYNDYLEHIEDIIFNLAEGIDVQATKAEVERYEAENKEQIEARKAQEQATRAHASAGGGAAAEGSQSQFGTEESDPFSAPDAFSLGSFAPRPASLLQPTKVRVEADHVQNLSEEELAARRARGQVAGGWSEEIAKRRCLEAAIGGLWGIAF